MKNINVIRFLNLLVALVFYCTYTYAKPIDSLSCSQSGSALQLDLIRVNGFAYLVPVASSARIRFGFDVNINRSNGSNDGTSIYNYSGPDTTYSQQTKNPTESNSFSGKATFSAVYLYDLITSNYFSFYAGIGPFITYSRSYSSYKYSYYRDTTVSLDGYNNSSYSWTYGAMAAFGIQIGITKEISVHAEYSLSAGYQKTTSSGSSWDKYSYNMSSSSSESSSNSKIWTFNGVIAGILFFF